MVVDIPTPSVHCRSIKRVNNENTPFCDFSILFRSSRLKITEVGWQVLRTEHE